MDILRLKDLFSDETKSNTKQDEKWSDDYVHWLETKVLAQENAKEKERILCAAIHNPEEKNITGGKLIHCGLRHVDVLWQSREISRNPYHQGFLTSTGRFVDRKEALKIAVENDQVLDKSEIRGTNLFSEDLY